MSHTELVRAASPPLDPRPWVLTGLDRANLILVLRGTWVFDAPIDASALRASLSRLLGLLPHLAGRLGRDGAIALSNQGVPFIEARRPDLTVAWVCEHPEQASLFSAPLGPGRVKRGKAAPLGITLTHLADGAVLGVRCSHACLDGQGFYGMVSLWSRLHRGESPAPPLLDQSLIPRPPRRPKAEVIREAHAAGWVKVSLGTLAWVLPRYLLGRLHFRAPGVPFSPEALGRLRRLVARGHALATQDPANPSPGPAEADNEAPVNDTKPRNGAEPRLPSINVALTAHLTRMCTRLFALPEGTHCAQVTVLDGRERLDGVPASFAGNAAFAVSTARFAAGVALPELAAQIERSLSVYASRPSPALLAEVRLGLELMDHRVLMAPYDLSAMHRRRPTLTYVNNFSRLPVYDVDFGSPSRPLTPIRVIPHDLPDPVLLWPAPPRTGGVEVYLAGVAARAALRLPPEDPWWRELRLET